MGSEFEFAIGGIEMIVKPYPCIIQINNENIDKNTICSGARLKLYHYTSFDTLAKIIKEKNFKLNRIDLVNDLEEKSYLGDAKTYSLVFVGCFSHRETESIPQWYMYTLKNKGVRISFFLKKALTNNCMGIIDTNRSIQVIKDEKTVKNYTYKGDFSWNLTSKWSLELSNTDIIYSNQLKIDNPILNKIDGESMVDIAPIAKIKRVEWDFEEETRIIGMFRTVHKDIDFEVPEYILLPLNFNDIDIEITLNPWSTDEFRSDVEQICNSYLKGYSYKICESVLKGTLASRK